jgi:hypothetical protein
MDGVSCGCVKHTACQLLPSLSPAHAASPRLSPQQQRDTTVQPCSHCSVLPLLGTRAPLPHSVVLIPAPAAAPRAAPPTAWAWAVRATLPSGWTTSCFTGTVARVAPLAPPAWRTRRSSGSWRWSCGAWHSAACEVAGGAGTVTGSIRGCHLTSRQAHVEHGLVFGRMVAAEATAACCCVLRAACPGRNLGVAPCKPSMAKGRRQTCRQVFAAVLWGCMVRWCMHALSLTGARRIQQEGMSLLSTCSLWMARGVGYTSR